ncbi:sulfite exporter TauE/SafE family protein [Leadbettera azotonutricia]|uniref:Probable membrane transporter protein n=1 Tax=Leadbettera azotonutricia (strain ATCC BAA-888 / DSM 13862 / ZAS-9) TaxID=545695 RepID=F5Y8P2_LEAAZ|nr:sulfite exporter TauE/SafE family protein [Leadbettera azotonutricia]AEF81303.1 integral membrane protein [Leadbettera azotonutricia ZAS-9]
MSEFLRSLPFQQLDVPWKWAAWIVLGLCIGLSKAGFTGITAIIFPIIAIIFGAKASTGLNLPLLCFADVLAVIYYNRHTEWKYIIKLLPWTLAGFGLALWVDTLVPVQAFKYLMGGCILAGLIVMIWNDRRGKDAPAPSSWWFSALFGIAGGFSTTIGNIAGPIMSVFLLSMQLPKNSFVGTSAWFFLIVNYIKLPVQVFLWKNITLDVLALDLTLIPFILIGGIVGVVSIKKISESLYRKVIVVLTLVSTIFLFI